MYHILNYGDPDDIMFLPALTEAFLNSKSMSACDVNNHSIEAARPFKPVCSQKKDKLKKGWIHIRIILRRKRRKRRKTEEKRKRGGLLLRFLCSPRARS